MIRVSGTATLKVKYSVELDMTEEEFDNRTPQQQNDLLDHKIDWLNECRNGELDDLEVDEVLEIA